MNYKYEILNPPEEKVKSLSKSLKLTPIVAKILINRGIETPEEAEKFLSGGVEALYPPYMIDDMEKAVGIILDNIDEGNKILIHGDYDADGVTSTSILIKALERIGGQPGYYIPDRFDEGYGFSADAINKAVEEGFSLIITVDCGSSNHEEVAMAKEKGLQIIITDHHEVPEIFPKADAFINTKKPGDNYPFKDLSGAGVALKLVSALYSELGRDDWVDFLDLAAIGTVADVVPLIGENRILVRAGLELINRVKRPGIASLLKIANWRRKSLIPWDISFIIAPKINAAGRLDDATVALKFLLEENPEEAAKLAEQLVSLNEERQRVEQSIKEKIEKMINETPDLLTQPVWVFGSQGWHQGVIGIVASRFADAFKRPVYLISIDSDGMGRGSARCAENYNIYEALDSSKDLLQHYGGHRLAGGFSLDAANIDEFRKRVSAPDLFSDVSKHIRIDAQLSPDEISLSLAHDIERLSPFGEGNAKPLFISRRIKFQSVTPVGATNQHLKVWVTPGKNYPSDLKGIFFGKGSLASEIRPNDLFYDILYNLDIDEWNNQEELSLKIFEIVTPDNDCLRILQGIEEIAINIPSDEEDGSQVSPLRIVDARGVIDRRKYIRKLSLSGGRVLILTRNKQQLTVLMKNLKREGVYCENLQDLRSENANGKLMCISSIDKIENRTTFTDVLFYHPPYYLSHFQNEIYACKHGVRVHLLFGDEDVAREDANQQILAPTRETLLKIFAYLKKNQDKEGKIGSITLEDVARKMANPDIKAITVRIALKIFHDINLLNHREERNTFHIELLENRNCNLDDSSTFQFYTKMKQEFLKIKDMLMSSSLDDFKRVLSNIIDDANKVEVGAES